MLRRSHVDKVESNLRAAASAWPHQGCRGFLHEPVEPAETTWVLEPDALAPGGYRLMIQDSDDADVREPTPLEMAEYQMAITVAAADAGPQ